MTESLRDDTSKNDSLKKVALIVDDSSTARQLLKKLLEGYGHDVLCAESAEIAIQMLNQTDQTHPDVIFMDHSMPGMDGLQALKTIKTNPRTAMIPILMYTSQGGSVYAEQAKRFGAVGIIPKELKHMALKQVLDSLDKIITRSKQGEHDFNDREFNDRAVSEENSTPEEPKPQKKTTTYQANIPPLTPQRTQSSVALTNITETLSDQPLEAMNKANNPVADHQKINASNDNVPETFHKRFLFDSIKTAQQQNQDIQSQVYKINQQLQQSLKNIKKWLASITCTLLGINLILWFNPYISVDNARVSSAVDSDKLNFQQPTNSQSIKEISTGSDDKNKNAHPLSNKDQQIQQLALLQNLLNQGTSFDFNSPPFGDVNAKSVEYLLKLLPTIGFSGTILLNAYLADFCVVEKNGSWQLANSNLPIDQCQFFSIDAMGYTELQSLEFSNLLNSVNPNSAIKIAVKVQEESVEAGNKPDINSVETAGKWNQLVKQNNRIEYQLISDAH